MKGALREEGVFAYHVYKSGSLLGFIMIRSYRDGYFLWNYAIDRKFQGRGYGAEILREFIYRLREKENLGFISTTYSFGNIRAKRLYESLGFIETDIVDEEGIHEVNMILKF